jgi:hypothetical protein
VLSRRALELKAMRQLEDGCFSLVYGTGGETVRQVAA